jgi:hypothetical protein
MKTTARLALTALLTFALGSAGPVLAQAGINPHGKPIPDTGPPPSASEAAKAVKKQQEDLLKEFDKKFKLVLDPGKIECYKDYNEAVKQASKVWSACVNNPSPDSPLGKFNAMTNVQLAQFCGKKTLQECVTQVISQQRSFCANKTDYLQHLGAAKRAEKHCLTCDTLMDELRALQAKLKAAGCTPPRTLIAR